MNRNIYKILTLLAVTIADTTRAGAQLPEQISVSGVRPINELRQALEKRYGWRITYEDPIYSTEELESTGARLLPPNKPLSMVVPPSLDSTTSPIAVSAQLKVALQQQDDKHFFDSVQNGDYIHVVPTANSDVDGKVKSYRSLLDEVVSFPTADRSVGETIQLVLQQIAEARGINIVLGSVPLNMFAQERQTREAERVKARDVLMAVFESASNHGVVQGIAPRRVSWSLLYEPEDKTFYFNAHIIQDNSQNAAPTAPGAYATGMLTGLRK